MQKQYKPNR